MRTPTSPLGVAGVVAAVLVGVAITVIVVLAIGRSRRDGPTASPLAGTATTGPTPITPTTCAPPAMDGPPAPILPDGLPLPAGLTAIEETTPPGARRVTGTVTGEVADVLGALRRSIAARPLLAGRVEHGAGAAQAFIIDGPSTSATYGLTSPCPGVVAVEVTLRPVAGPPPPLP